MEKQALPILLNRKLKFIFGQVGDGDGLCHADDVTEYRIARPSRLVGRELTTWTAHFLGPTLIARDNRLPLRGLGTSLFCPRSSRLTFLLLFCHRFPFVLAAFSALFDAAVAPRLAQGRPWRAAGAPQIKR